MPDLEWMALGAEPGCRQAAMDPQIKLFGQTISVIPSHTGAGADAGVLRPTSASPPWDAAPTSSQDGGDSALLGTENKGVSEKIVSARSSSRDEFLQLFKASSALATECGAPNAGALLCDDNNSEGAPSDELKEQGLDGDHHSSHSAGDGGKNLQKPPDKVVACPRCNSQDTKFCYYNNYNVNQPRHFCKHCQRYWTAGGTLRNVPVGAGRRKNKSGGGGGLQQQHRDNNGAEASPNCSFQIDSGELFSCGPLAPPKRLAPGQSSPLRSPGSATTTSFGQESGMTILSPPYSLYQNGRLPFQSFNSCSQAFTTSGAEASAMGSSDSASTLRGQQRLVRFPSGNHGLDNKDCSRSSSLSGQLQDAASLGAMRPAAFNASGTYRSDYSGWAGSGGQPVRFFNGEWPHGYNLDWDGKHPASASRTVPFLSSQNTAATTTPPNPTSSWSPALAPWASNATTHASNARAATGWTGTAHSRALQPSLGKRRGVLSDDSPAAAAKLLRTDVECCKRSAWPMLQARTTTTTPSAEVFTTSVGTLKQLFHPKLEPSSAACEPKDTFMSRLFNNRPAAAPRPAPFPVTT